jgi:hypothetical protein
MGFGDFHKLEDTVKKLNLLPVDHMDLFADCPEVAPSASARDALLRGLPLATAIGTEKARSELLVAPLLLDLKYHAPDISIFSGVEFSVDPDAGLTGVCDFLVSRAPEQYMVRAPVVALVEAKKDDLREGMAQCLAEMVAALTFNEREGNDIATVYGAATTGVAWKFMALTERTATLDLKEHMISRPEKILGILFYMATGRAP